jgi:rubrerythrin
MEFSNSKTKVNLMRAFAGESQARNRYTFYASQARKNGYIQISDIFLETAENEKEHAEVFYKLLTSHMNNLFDNDIEITAGYPVSLSTTLDNLSSSAAAEHGEAETVYPSFAEVAKQEGFDDIAFTFNKIAEVEKAHETRFLKLADNVRQNKVFKRDEDVQWKCANCGYIHTGNKAPDKCPACDHPIDYYELFVENY